jgi:hypothetical protein
LPSEGTKPMKRTAFVYIAVTSLHATATDSESFVRRGSSVMIHQTVMMVSQLQQTVIGCEITARAARNFENETEQPHA